MHLAGPEYTISCTFDRGHREFRSEQFLSERIFQPIKGEYVKVWLKEIDNKDLVT
ncbi:MAG: hypothetical protein Ct9H300mP18_13210 [Candidatus Neomarinimicrobiota bacterium]|nr:MAG: hypothetical protein Ct9H300mP18_13210 [Candidatus Neomarinimicrobiota bacterium]